MTTMGPIASWNPGQGPVTTWTASPRTRTAMRLAPVDPLPPSAQQAQHLWMAHYGAAAGREMPRLMVTAWDEEGLCDITAMTAAINAHVRRHDTYRSAFEVVGPNTIQRRTIADPQSVELVPTAIGFMTADDVRAHALNSTPGTLDGDCFTFGVLQSDDHFSVYASIDHLHIDGTSAALIFLDIHLSYQAAVHGLPDPLPSGGRYRDYTARQREHIAAATLHSAEVKSWIDFARDGDWPGFPLPVGDTAASPRGGWVTIDLLGTAQTEAFDAACRAAGARFSGGVMACAAMADHHFTGSESFHCLSPSDTRAGEDEATSVGWFASLFPVTVPVGDGAFAGMARAAQASFDANRSLAAVPFQRVVELAPADQLGITTPDRPSMMLSYQDFRKMPFADLWDDSQFGFYGDNLSLGGINLWVNRQAAKTTVTVSFPDNAEARRSLRRYLTALTAAFTEAASTATRTECALTATIGPEYRSGCTLGARLVS